MQIAHVTYGYRPITGGGEVYLAQLYRVLEKAGHRQIVFQRPDGAESEELRVTPNPLRRLPGPFWTQAAFLPLVGGELRKQDLIISHYPPYLLGAAVARGLRSRPPLVGISHGVFWDDRPGSFRSGLKRSLSWLAFRLARAYVANDTNFLRQMGLKIAPGEGAFSEVAPGVWFIPNAVDTRRFRRTRPIPALKALNPILVPRNLFRNRGIHLAIAAFAEFHRAHQRTNLVIVGAASQPSYAARLRRQAFRLGLAARVVFRGHVSHKEMAAVYCSSQMTLIPSLCGEGTSLAALESMACGICTLSTNVAGLADLPTVKSPPTSAGLAAAMSRAWEQREALGQQQRTTVTRDFSFTRWRAAWLEVIARAGGA